jgi:hypothetical protein
MTTPFYAAVDLGSNAFRMMIGRPAPIGVSHVIKEVASFREPVRLSHGLRGSELDDSSLERNRLVPEVVEMEILNQEVPDHTAPRAFESVGFVLEHAPGELHTLGRQNVPGSSVKGTSRLLLFFVSGRWAMRAFTLMCSHRSANNCPWRIAVSSASCTIARTCLALRSTA